MSKKEKGLFSQDKEDCMSKKEIKKQLEQLKERVELQSIKRCIQEVIKIAKKQ